MLQLEPFYELLELILRSAHLFLDQIRTVLQVDPDVTHGLFPFSSFRAVNQQWS
jgi:hypothetical protein